MEEGGRWEGQNVQQLKKVQRMEEEEEEEEKEEEEDVTEDNICSVVEAYQWKKRISPSVK
jgi:hypothetical protein